MKYLLYITLVIFSYTLNAQNYNLSGLLYGSGLAYFCPSNHINNLSHKVISVTYRDQWHNYFTSNQYNPSSLFNGEQYRSMFFDFNFFTKKKTNVAYNVKIFSSSAGNIGFRQTGTGIVRASYFIFDNKRLLKSHNLATGLKGNILAFAYGLDYISFRSNIQAHRYGSSYDFSSNVYNALLSSNEIYKTFSSISFVDFTGGMHYQKAFSTQSFLTMGFGFFIPLARQVFYRNNYKRC